MTRFIITRLALTVVMAVLATLVIFLISNTVPGDPVLAALGDVAASNKEFVAEWRAKWGLDLPLWQRYLIFLKGVVQGDLGISIASQRPVLEDIAQFAPATIELATVAFLITLIVGIPLGIMAAVWRDTWIDHVARVVSLIGVSSPTFWLAFIMLAIFYGGLEIAPGPGRLDPIAMPPSGGTGLLLIDTLVAGDWRRSATLRRTSSCRQSCLPPPRSASSPAPCAPPCWRASSRTTCASPAPKA